MAVGKSDSAVGNFILKGGNFAPKWGDSALNQLTKIAPPLAGAYLASLGLKPRDTNPTSSGAPTAQASRETFLAGRHQLGVKIVRVTENPDAPANKSYRLWYSIVAHGETPPASPDDLRKSYSAKRKKDLIDFNFGDSGKTAYFAVQMENGDKKGPWGRWYRR